MDEPWQCPFCEQLHPWPVDVSDIVDGRTPPRNYTPGEVFRAACECGARAVVNGLVEPQSPLLPRPEPYLDEDARKHSRLFSFALRQTVYRRTNAAGQTPARAAEDIQPDRG